MPDASHYPHLGFDPSPGDPARLDEVGTAWARLGARLADQAREVRALQAGEVWRGRAADACLSRLHVVPRDLQTAAEACVAAGRSLRGYAEHLVRLQRSAASLESAAAEQARAIGAATDDAQTARRQLAAVLHDAYRLRDEADEQSRAVAAALAAAREDATQSPGWFHRMLHDLGADLHHVAAAMHDLVVKYAPQIASVAAWCSKAASVLAEAGFFVSLVPGVGDAIGGGLLLLSIGLGATAMAGHAVLAAEGDGSWKAVAFDGAALAVALVSRGMDVPIEEAAEAEAAQAATRAPVLRDLPSMSEREFVLRAVRLHVDGAGAALGTVDLARIGEDWPVLVGRGTRGRLAQHAAGAA